MLSFEIRMMKVFDPMCDAAIEIENIVYGCEVKKFWSDLV